MYKHRQRFPFRLAGSLNPGGFAQISETLSVFSRPLIALTTLELAAPCPFGRASDIWDRLGSKSAV